MSAIAIKPERLVLSPQQAQALIVKACETMQAAIQDINDGFDGSAKVKLMVFLAELLEPEAVRRANEFIKRMEEDDAS